MNGVINREDFNRTLRQMLDNEFHRTHMEMTIQNNLTEIERQMRDGVIPPNDVMRISVNEDGTINIFDFGLMTLSKRESKNVPQKDVPPWIMESISMLRIVEEGDLVPELGFKVNDHLYYVIDRTGESHE